MKKDNALLNFLELSEYQKEIFRQRIKKNQGLVRIFIHPYYEHVASWVRESKHPTKIESIHLIIQRILALPDDRTPPILFFEEYHRLSILDDIIRSMKIVQNTSYIVPTYISMSEPKHTPLDDSEGKQSSEKRNWQVVVNKLKALGVTKILIGGMYLFIAKNGTTIMNKFGGCAGSAINRLFEDFDIEISSRVFPEDRKNAKKLLKKSRA